MRNHGHKAGFVNGSKREVQTIRKEKFFPCKDSQAMGQAARDSRAVSILGGFQDPTGATWSALL